MKKSLNKILANKFNITLKRSYIRTLKNIGTYMRFLQYLASNFAFTNLGSLLYFVLRGWKSLDETSYLNVVCHWKYVKKF